MVVINIVWGNYFKVVYPLLLQVYLHLNSMKTTRRPNNTKRWWLFLWVNCFFWWCHHVNFEKWIAYLLMVMCMTEKNQECRNPTLAKCKDELTLPKLGTWSPPGLPNVYSSTTEAETPQIRVFLVSLERSWSVDVQMTLHWSFGHLQPKLWAKEGPGVKLAVWFLTIKSRESTSSQRQ